MLPFCMLKKNNEKNEKTKNKHQQKKTKKKTVDKIRIYNLNKIKLNQFNSHLEEHSSKTERCLFILLEKELV